MKGFKISFYDNSGNLVLLSKYDSEQSNNILTFNENITEDENNRFSLNFSVLANYAKSTRLSSGLSLINYLRIGRRLRVEFENHWNIAADNYNYVDMTIISISPEGKPDNIIYNIVANDNFSYIFTRSSVGITYDSMEDSTLVDLGLDNNIFNLGNYLLERGHLQTAVFTSATYAVAMGSPTYFDNQESEIILYDGTLNRWKPNITRFYMDLYTDDYATVQAGIEFTPTEPIEFEYDGNEYSIFYSDNRIHLLVNDLVPLIGTNFRYKLYYSYNISTFTGWQIKDNNIIIAPDDVLYKKYNISISDSNTYNGLIELANLSNALIEVNYKDKYIYYYDKNDIRFIKNYQLSPKFNLENFSLNYDGNEFYSMFYVTGGEDEYGLQVTMLPYLDLASSQFLANNVDIPAVIPDYVEDNDSYYTNIYNNTNWSQLVPPGSVDYDNLQKFINIANRNPHLDNFILDLSYYTNNYLLEDTTKIDLLNKINNDLRKINTKFNYWSYIKNITESDIFLKEQSIITKAGLVVDEDQTSTFAEQFTNLRKAFKEIGDITIPQDKTIFISPTDYFSNTPAYPSPVLVHPAYIRINDSTVGDHWVTTNSNGIVQFTAANKYQYYFVFSTPAFANPIFSISAYISSKNVATLMSNMAPGYARDTKIESYLYSYVPIIPISLSCDSSLSDVSSLSPRTLTNLSFTAIFNQSIGSQYEIRTGADAIILYQLPWYGGNYIYTASNQDVTFTETQWNELVSWVSSVGTYTYTVIQSTLEYVHQTLAYTQETYPFFELLNNYKGYKLIEEKEKYYRNILIDYIKERQNIEAQLSPLETIQTPTTEESLLISTLTAHKNDLIKACGTWTYSETTDTITSTINLGLYSYIYQMFLDYHKAGEYLGDVVSSTFTATAGQTEFIVAYDPVSVDEVAINGTLLLPTEYTVDRVLKKITLDTGASAGQTIAITYRNIETIYDKYSDLYNNKHELLYEIYRDYGQYLVAGYYENDIETDPAILYNQALIYMEQYKKPAENYNITYLDISNIIGQDIKSIQVGDKINIFNQNLGIFEESTNEIQVVSISRDLRKDNGMSLTVNRQRDLTYLENIFLQTYKK